MSFDFLRSQTLEVSTNLALHILNVTPLKQHAQIGLPTPTGNAEKPQLYDRFKERQAEVTFHFQLNKKIHQTLSSLRHSTKSFMQSTMKIAKPDASILDQ